MHCGLDFGTSNSTLGTADGANGPRLLPLVASGRLPVERIVSSCIPLADVVEDGFRRLDTAGCDEVKIVVLP